MKMTVKEEFSLKSEIFDWFEAICFSMIAVILVFTVFIRSAQVDGDSMLPTLNDTDRLLLVNTAITGVEYGDIVVITQPTSIGHPIIKRVIATEGQTVNIDFEKGMVYVDGILKEEPYILEATTSIPNNCVEFPFTVDEGHVFVMGDNRNNSTDSRDADVGQIDERYILGKAFFRLFPFENAGFIGSIE
ncbi:MAG: signal peptidase I [Ruminococcaceae bacterium]|nr:signal peptidase I [Oscillospiraceae bacterium]